MKTKFTMITFLLAAILLQGCGTLCSETKNATQCESMRQERMERFETGSRGGQ